MFTRSQRLEQAERRAIASYILQTDITGHGPKVAGAEKFRQRGTRVAASLGGMFIELSFALVRPDIDLQKADLGVIVKAALSLRRYWLPEDLPDAAIDRIVRQMTPHWRDGNFEGLRLEQDRIFIIRLAMTLQDAFERGEINGLTGAERWPHDRLLEYWDLETKEFADKRGRW
jgi:hypothetical protein